MDVNCGVAIYLQHGSAVRHPDGSGVCPIDPVWVAILSADYNDVTVYDVTRIAADHMDQRPNTPTVRGSAVAADSGRCDGTVAESTAAESRIARLDGALMMCCRGCCDPRYHHHG